MAGKRHLSGGRHAGPTRMRAVVLRPTGGPPGARTGSAPIGSSREPLAGKGSHLHRVLRRGVPPVLGGSSARRIGPPNGHHRAGGTDPLAQWNPLPIGDWQAPERGRRWRDESRSPATGHHPARIGGRSTPRTAPRGRFASWIVLGGLVAAALAGAAGVTIMATASARTAPVPGQAPVTTTSTSIDATGTPATLPSEPSSALQIAEPTTPRQTVPPVPAASASTQAPAAATVFVLAPGDPGFGWPSTAFGSAQPTSE